MHSIQLAKKTQIGLIQDWTPSHSRTITPVRGIGYGDQVAEMAVGVTEITANINTMGMYLKNLQQVFGYKSDTSGIVRSIKHHKWPFDVYEEIVIPQFLESDASKMGVGSIKSSEDHSVIGAQAIYTVYEGCWMSTWEHGFTIGDVSVTQSSNIYITDVTDGFSDNYASYTDAPLVANKGVSRIFQ